MKTGTWSARNKDGFSYYFGNSKDGLIQSGPNDLLEDVAVVSLYPKARKRFEKEWIAYFEQQKQIDEFERLGMWDKDLSDGQAGKRGLGLGLGLTIPNPLKSGTLAANAAKGTVIATGQRHHLLSNKILRALNSHPVLRRLFNRTDPKFIYKAYDASSHNGYQTWHREYDAKVVEWLGTFTHATADDFIKFLNNLHQEPWLKNRIPNVNLLK